MTSITVGFVGIGTMGEPMVRNLAAAGYDLVLCDTNTAQAERVAGEIGAKALPTAKALAVASDLVITMLPNSAIVEAVVFGENGLAGGLREGAVVADMSSGDPATTRDIGERLSAQGVKMIDAPVSGGLPRAKSGDLTIMAGGDADGYALAQPALETMGAPTYVGEILGAGQALKALNNLVSAGGFLIGIEALLIGQKFGLDPDIMVDVLNSSSGMNNSTQRKFKQYVLTREFDAAGFALSLMAKDVGIALKVAEGTGTPVPFSGLCREMWAAASKMLGPDADHTAITRMCETFAGSELGTAKKGDAA